MGTFISMRSASIASGWTECGQSCDRDSNLIVEALTRLRLALPFSLRGMDVDSGGEFVDDALLMFWQLHGLEFRRSPPYQKNDQTRANRRTGPPCGGASSTSPLGSQQCAQLMQRYRATKARLQKRSPRLHEELEPLVAETAPRE
jgi:hypothetical protein